MHTIIYNKLYGSLFAGAVIFFLFVSTSAEIRKRNLSGYLIDLETNKPIVSASVEIIEASIYTTSNENGLFTFGNISEGNYTVKILHLAYKEKLVPLKLDENTDANFVIFLTPKTIEISSVIVTDVQQINDLENYQELRNVLKGKELQKELGSTLAATLKNETGLAMRSMGPAPARPVIRGLGGDRVFIAEDGIKSSDLSATSPDHAVTIEPFSSDRIEVIRGPKVLTKSSTTIGGVVNVIKNEIPTQIHDEIYGTTGIYAESANKGFLYSLSGEVPLKPFTARVEVSKHLSTDIRTPEGILKNSHSENINYSGGLSYFFNSGFGGASFRNYELEYGVPGGFIGAHPFGVDIKLFRQQFNFQSRIDIKSAYFDNIDFRFSSSHYRHQEFEKSGRIGSEFRIISNYGSIELKQNSIGVFNSGTLGINFEKRDFDIGGYVFTVPTVSTKLSAFVFESFKLSKLTFEGSARFNYDHISPQKEKPESKIGAIRKRVFNTYSLSISVLYPLTNIVHIGANISKSSRVPTIEELFSEGPHLAAYSYEVGNPDLSAEQGFGSELFIYHKFNRLYYNLNFFMNRLNNYIIPRNSGKINYATFLPIYVTSGERVKLYGFEAQTDWNFYNEFTLNTSFSYTRGVFNESGASLPQIPPFKGIIGIEFKDDELNFGVNSEIALSQNNVDNFEEPTKGYLIFNFFGQYSFNQSGQIHTFSLNAENITNKTYRNHLSRVKSILPEAGINFRLTYKLYFHL